MKGDPELAAKWEAREAEWYRLAGSTSDPWIARSCRESAEMAGRMANFWRGGK